jgi:16S rRNA (guanine966-N2)-methyltransferase
VRIIGGRWRGRRLQFPAAAAIRPTPDRVRETLFNWLAGRIEGANCLDLFAGSGALGMEALSRGAASVTFVERDARTLAAIENQYEQWRAAEPEAQSGRATFIRADARAWLRSHGRGAAESTAPFDLVFLDPPFAEAALAAEACATLEAAGRLAADARIYVESPLRPAGSPAPGLPARTTPAVDVAPPGWEVLRAGAAGEVGYHLLGRGRAAAATGAQTP